jgi:hypothetical protein
VRKGDLNLGQPIDNLSCGAGYGHAYRVQDIHRARANVFVSRGTFAFVLARPSSGFIFRMRVSNLRRQQRHSAPRAAIVAAAAATVATAAQADRRTSPGWHCTALGAASTSRARVGKQPRDSATLEGRRRRRFGRHGRPAERTSSYSNDGAAERVAPAPDCWRARQRERQNHLAPTAARTR